MTATVTRGDGPSGWACALARIVGSMASVMATRSQIRRRRMQVEALWFESMQCDREKTCRF